MLYCATLIRIRQKSAIREKMESSTDYVDINGAMDLVKKSPNFFAPIFEAITNSFEAISIKSFPENKLPFIEVNFYFSHPYVEMKDFDKIQIVDNGFGFDEDSYKRYKKLFDKSKNLKNRGSGRLQFLHRFSKVEVESVYYKDTQAYKRIFYSDDRNLTIDATDLPIEGIDVQESGTVITMSGFKEDKNEKISFDKLTITEIQNEIKKKFFLKLYLEKEQNLGAPQIKINFFKNGEIESEAIINPKDIIKPENVGEIKVNYEKINDVEFNDVEWVTSTNSELLKWAHWKLPIAELDQNGIFLCSKDVAIQPISFLKIKKNENLGGYRHLTVVYGDILDKAENLTDAVDKFRFRRKKEVEREAIENMFYNKDEEFFLMDNINKKVTEALAEIYTEYQTLKTEQNTKVEHFAELHGIPIEIAKSAGIDLSDSDEKIVEKIYKKQAEENSKRNYQIQKLFDNLIELDSTTNEYPNELEKRGKELLELIPLQNKQELSRYVIRREMITKILQKISKGQMNAQTNPSTGWNDKEGLIHDLIFKRKTQTDSLNDLWVLNEEFMHFEGCSELPLNQIVNSKGDKLLKDNLDEEKLLEEFGIKKATRRPDIFLYMEEGKCILIEFKQVNANLKDHLNQLTEYCNLIANYSEIKIDLFYCYLIGEDIRRGNLPGEYTRSVTGDFVKPYQPIKSIQEGKEDETIAGIYQEVIQLSTLHARAAIRNKSFADKLGIRIKEVPLTDEQDN
jgi:hypothetical protein